MKCFNCNRKLPKKGYWRDNDGWPICCDCADEIIYEEYDEYAESVTNLIEGKYGNNIQRYKRDVLEVTCPNPKCRMSWHHNKTTEPYNYYTCECYSYIQYDAKGIVERWAEGGEDGFWEKYRMESYKELEEKEMEA